MPLAPKKINPFVMFDWETGGLDCTKHPVTELAMIAIDGVTLNEIVKYDDLIKPYDETLEYTEGAAKVSGITKQRCERDGITIEELSQNMVQVFKEANVYKTQKARPILVAHNADFDRGFLQHVATRTNLDLSKYIDGEFDYFGNFIPHVIDTIDLAKQVHAHKTEHTTNFKLGSCCQRAGVSYVDGHKALNDTESLLDLFRYYVTRLRSGSSDVSVIEGQAVAAHRQVYEW